MRDREKKAKDEFQEMLGENSFIEFWGKVSKIQDKSTGDGMAIPNEEDDEQGGEEAGGKVDLKDLAKGVGEKQMEDVLKVRTSQVYSSNVYRLFFLSSMTSVIEYSIMCRSFERSGSRYVVVFDERRRLMSDTFCTFSAGLYLPPICS
jgi:hypothetical protein